MLYSPQVDTTGIREDRQMTITTVKSEEARLNWRDTLDTAHTGGAVVIERYSKPVAVVVNYEQWQKERTRLKELELAAEARRIKAAVASGEMGTTSGDELLRL